MAKRKSAQQIVEESMPKVRIMPPAETPPVSDEDDSLLARGVSADDLKRRYLEESGRAGALQTSDQPQESSSIEQMRRRFLGAETAHSAAPGTDSDVEIVRVKSNSDTADESTGPGVRAVIVSKSQGRIIGRQG